jgi:hypothetical protein
MPQPPPPAPQGAGLRQDDRSDDEEPAAKAESKRSVSLPPHSGQTMESAGAEIDWSRAKTARQDWHRYS